MIERVIARASSATAAVAGVALLAMLALTVVNMFMRVLATPYFGTVDIVSLLAVLVNGLALAEAQRHKTHVAIELVTSRFSMRVQLVIGAITTLLSMAIFSVAAWRLVIYAQNLADANARTDSIGIAYWPAAMLLAAGIVVLVLVLLRDLLLIGHQWRDPDPQGIW